MKDSEFLDPKVLATVQNLELVAKCIVEGYLLGLHKSPYHGFSAEFAAYREYTPSDTLRYIDWKLWGRTDKYYIKQYEENTNTCVHLLVDVSASMSVGNPVSKWNYASRLSAAIAYMGLHQGDAVSLTLFSEKDIHSIPASRRPSHLQVITDLLTNTTPHDETNIACSITPAIERLKRKGIVIIISDMIDELGATIEALRLLRGRGHDVVVLQLLAQEEREFPYKNEMLFIDPETNNEVRMNGGYVRLQYLEELNKHNAKLKDACQDMGITVSDLSTAVPAHIAIASFVAQRKGARL